MNPYCRIGDLVAAGIAKRQVASVYLKTLTEQGLLQEMKAGREKFYINPAPLSPLSERHGQTSKRQAAPEMTFVAGIHASIRISP